MPPSSEGQGPHRRRLRQAKDGRNEGDDDENRGDVGGPSGAGRERTGAARSGRHHRAPSARAPTTSSGAGTSRLPSPVSRSAATRACSRNRRTASSSRSVARPGCPTRFLPRSRVMRAQSESTCSRDTDRRVWRNCLYTLDGDGNVKERWTQWDHLCEGSTGPGPHRLRISPYDPERRVWLDQRDVPSDLRHLQRRQQAAEDAGREERSGKRWQALRPSPGRGVSAGRQDSRGGRPGQPPRDDPRPRGELPLGVRRLRQRARPVQRRARGGGRTARA